MGAVEGERAQGARREVEREAERAAAVGRAQRLVASHAAFLETAKGSAAASVGDAPPGSNAAEAAALVRRAHETAFPDYVYAGWDVALTEAGPVQIEGNAKATMTSAQRPGLTIMAAERFQTLLAQNLARGDLRRRKPAL